MTVTTDPLAATSPAAPPVDVDDVDFLLGMDPEEFRGFVLAHLGRDEPDPLWTALCHPDVVLHTGDVLREKGADVNEALRTRKQHIDDEQAAFQAGRLAPAAWRQAHTDYQDWHRRAVRFSRMLQARAGQVRTARRARHEIVGTQRRGDLTTLVRQLTEGVNTHRLASVHAQLEPEPHDEALWGLLDRLRLPDDHDHEFGGLTLAEALLRGGLDNASDRAETAESAGTAA